MTLKDLTKKNVKINEENYGNLTNVTELLNVITIDYGLLTFTLEMI